MPVWAGKPAGARGSRSALSRTARAAAAATAPSAATARAQPRFVTDSHFALRRAACDGLGLALASAWIVADDMAAGRLVRILPRWHGQSLPVYVGYPSAREFPMGH